MERLERTGLTGLFDFSGAYPYTRMLDDQIAGKNDSWTIRWYASAFLADRLTLYPGQKLVRNIGNDASETHSGRTDAFDSPVATVAPGLTSIEVAESAAARVAFETFFREMRSKDARPGPRESRSRRLVRRLWRRHIPG